MKNVLFGLIVVGLLVVTQPVQAAGVFAQIAINAGNRQAVRQQVRLNHHAVVQRVVVQKVVAQQVYAQPIYQQQFVQRVYAQPIVQQQIYAQPIVQQYSQPVCNQQVIQGYTQQLNSGCGQFFRSH